MVNGQAAVIRAALALGHGSGILQGLDLIDWEHGSTFTLHIAFPGDQGGPESPHDTCDIRADCFTVCDLFKAPQHGIVIESSSLHHNMVSKLRGIGNLNYLK